MKILMITPEVAPYVKVGGLADVVGALPKELAALGHDVRVVCPLYGSVRREGDWIPYEHPLGAVVGRQEHFCKVWETAIGNSSACAYFLEHDQFYGRSEVYAGPWGDHEDNPERFAFLCRAALNLCYYLGWMPDVIHCHDWTTGIVPVILNTSERRAPLGRAASVFTIHNLLFQGHMPKRYIDLVDLDEKEVFHPHCLESFGSVNLMKGGLYNASKITTVSPTYAREIQEEAGGCGLDGLLRFRSADLVGILNGIDEDAWDPAKDKFLPQNYSAADLKGKAVCKADLQKELGLPVDPTIPVFGVISRLYEQKGLDLLANIAGKLVREMKIQLVVLGNGDAKLQDAFRRLAAENPAQVSVFIGFNNGLSHRIYAGSDYFLMPSRFEPCGLSQMYSMRYGTLPIVRSTGGLADTVTAYDEATGEGRGFVFEHATEDALFNTIGWACSTWYDRPDHYRKLQQAGMTANFSWDGPVREYEQVYRWAIDARRQAFAL